MNLAVPAGDQRAIEVLASGLPLYHGAQLAIDVTVRGALSVSGVVYPRAADEDGVVVTKARADKEAKYAELLNAGRCRLVVVAIETGGRWSGEVVTFF